MNITECINTYESILMEGALGERLKREYNLVPNEYVALADMVYDEKGIYALTSLWEEYIKIAKKYELPFLATTPTRGANRERVEQSPYTSSIIDDNVKILRSIQQRSNISMYVGGLMGCKGDAYTGEGALSIEESRAFYSWQAELFAVSNADFLYAGIMPAIQETIGMAQAMSDTDLPYIISFTIQGDGKLIDGTTITDAINRIDDSVTRQPICYMTNCVHPDIVYEALLQPWNQNDTVKHRFLGIQANTSPLPYAKLDSCADLLSSEPKKLAKSMMELRKINKMKIFGGCCGTDQRHMEEIAKLLHI